MENSESHANSDVVISKAKVSKIRVSKGEIVSIKFLSEKTENIYFLVGNFSIGYFLIPAIQKRDPEFPHKFLSLYECNLGVVSTYLRTFEKKTVYLTDIVKTEKLMSVSMNGTSCVTVIEDVNIATEQIIYIEALYDGVIPVVVIMKYGDDAFLMLKNGTTVSTKDIKEGDEVLVYMEIGVKRHYGEVVDDYIKEKFKQGDYLKEQ